MIDSSRDHPITITPFDGHITVTVGNTVVADTRHALALQEASYPVVYYVPKADVASSFLVPSDHSTHCPYKGDASYWSIALAGTRIDNAVWSYQRPLNGVAAIKDYLAFYPNKVTMRVDPVAGAA